MEPLYQGTYNVLTITGNQSFDYFFTNIVVFIPVIVTIYLVIKTVSRS